MLTLEQLYQVLVLGKFHSQAIDVSFDPSCRLLYSAEEREEIENTWLEATASGSVLYDGLLPRFLTYKERDGLLFLELGLTSYKE